MDESTRSGTGAVNVLGKYRLIAELGHGGMAEVFLAVAHGPAGFNKLQAILPPLLNEQLADGFCVGKDSVGSPNSFPYTGADYCTNNNGSSCNPGCKVNVSLNSVTPSVVSQNRVWRALKSVATSSLSPPTGMAPGR